MYHIKSSLVKRFYNEKQKSAPAQAKRSAPKSASKGAAKRKTPPETATKNKNVSKRYPNGRTLKTKDKYLPIIAGQKSNDPKDERWVAIIDSNKKDELAVVRLTTQNQPNTTHLPTYKKGNSQRSFFKHFVEIEDVKGDPIKVDRKRFQENPKAYDLSKREVEKIQDKVLRHSKQSSENKKKIATLKENGDV